MGISLLKKILRRITKYPELATRIESGELYLYGRTTTTRTGRYQIGGSNYWVDSHKGASIKVEKISVNARGY